jgi:hypothetical protein
VKSTNTLLHRAGPTSPIKTWDFCSTKCRVEHNNTMDGLTHRIAIPRLENLWKDSLFSAQEIDNVLNMRDRSHLLF